MSESLRISLLVSLATLCVGCAGPPDAPPFTLSHPDHPEGWRRIDLERDDDQLTQWRILLPYAAKAPRGAGLRAETYKTLDKSYTPERLYSESTALERSRCPGSRSRLIESGRSRVVFESTAPYESDCWGYQLVRLERGHEAIHALLVYAHTPPAPAERSFWLDIISHATFDPPR